MPSKSAIVLLSCLVISFILAACSNDDAQPASSAVAIASQEPVTLTVTINSTFLTDQEFEDYVAAPVKKKYPNITLEKITLGGGTNLETLIASGKSPDLHFHASNLLPNLKNFKAEYNLEELIKKHQFDLSRIDPKYLDAVKITSEYDYLIAIPYTLNFGALYYNKDIFDKFGIPYPPDGMTWEDATELAKKLTRLEDGTQYRGLEPDIPMRPGSQLSIPIIDPKTQRAVLNNEPWKKVYQMLSSVYAIPGNGEIKGNQEALNQFAKDRTLAMLAGLNWLSTITQAPNLNWDIAQYPSFKEKPGVSMFVDAHTMMVMPTSNHKDAAFQVIESVLSDEVQMNMARHARVSVLKDPKFSNAFGKDVPALSGKHIESAFRSKAAAPYPPTQYGNIAQTEMNKAIKEIVGGKDINTALREAEDALNKQIQSSQGK